MTDFNVVTAAEQPINRDGAVANEALVEGDTVGLNSDGKLVKAEAATGSIVECRGIMVQPVDDHSSYPSDAQFEPYVKIAESERVDIDQNKAAFAVYGVEVYNADEDSGWTPGDTVYLAEGGGFTTTAPANTGDLQQSLGFVLPDGESFFLDIDHDPSTSA